MAPGDTQTFVMAQFVARGTSNLNSVTKLKELSDVAQNLYDTGFVIGVKSISSTIPMGFKLHQNYPNPFNPATNIRFEIPRTSLVKLIAYDILGRKIATLVNEKLNAGSYKVNWDASNYPSGVYFYKLVTGDFVDVKKMVLIK